MYPRYAGIATVSPPAVVIRATLMPVASDSGCPRDAFKRINHSKYGSQQTDQRCDIADCVKDSQKAAQAIGHTVACVHHCLLNFEHGASPASNCGPEHLGDGAIVFFAEFGCFFVA